MKEYRREYPLFSLCGLNCGLCPRYQTSGTSKCPGCGGPDFHLKHPTCAVVTCNKKHDKVEYCFQCASYPCERYRKRGNTDSFISYRNVILDFQKASENGVYNYITELNEKISIVEFLIANYNDGRRKTYYCNAVNLLGLPALRDIMAKINDQIDEQDIDLKEKITQVVALFEAAARKENVELKLRK